VQGNQQIMCLMWLRDQETHHFKDQNIKWI